MRRIVSPWLMLLPLAFAPSASASAGARAVGKAPESDSAARVDRLFARWDHDTTPGGAVCVIRDGAVVYRRAFGMAELDFGAANTPQTLFHIASVSKQFTAFAVLLLEQDGKLSLDDDVRKYVPEVPDFGHTITVRHLLHHTSGLRDQPHLMWMAGWRFEDELTTGDVLRVLSRQRGLNFAPGEGTTYSNTGYTMLAVIVERVSGQALARFTRERVFGPLGMTRSLVQDDHRMVVRNRAASYRPAKGGGYERLSLSDSTVGQTGVVTSVDDLVLWDRNFEDGKVGGKELVARMLQRGRRNDGEPTRYAAGLGVDEYRGQRIVEHSGSVAAYRCHYLRLPDRRLSVIVLGNAEDLPATDLAHEVADVYLEDVLGPRPKPADAKTPAAAPAAAVEVPSELLDAYAGDYQLGPGDFVTISRDGTTLMAQGTGSGKVPLTASSPTTFLLPKAGSTVTFVKEAGQDQARELRLSQKGKEKVAPRVPSPPPSDYVGDYYSCELGVVYEVRNRDGKLLLNHPRGEIAMTRTTADQYDVPFPLRSLRFGRDPTGRCDHFLLEGERVRQVRFAKVNLGE